MQSYLSSQQLHKLKYYSKVLLMVLLLSSCKKESDENTNQPPSPLLPAVLYSTSFETNNSPDITGWNLFYDYYNGVSYDTIVASTCPNGGAWALNLKAQRLHFSYAEKYITNLGGLKKLKLSFMATLYSGQNSVTASLTHLRYGVVLKSKEINLHVWNNWIEFVIQDTISLSPTDSLRIYFRGTGSTYESSDVILDLLKLEEL